MPIEIVLAKILTETCSNLKYFTHFKKFLKKPTFPSKLIEFPSFINCRKFSGNAIV